MSFFHRHCCCLLENDRNAVIGISWRDCLTISNDACVFDTLTFKPLGIDMKTRLPEYRPAISFVAITFLMHHEVVSLGMSTST